MTKPVQGFLTYDNRFFESKEIAEYEEYLALLSDTFERSLYGAMPVTMLVNFIEENLGLVQRFCFAVEDKRRVNQDELTTMQEGKTYGADQGQDAVENEDTKQVDDSGISGNDADGNYDKDTDESIPNADNLGDT